MLAKQYLDKRQQAERLLISTRTLERLCADQGFPFIRLGKQVRFDPDLTEKYLAARAGASEQKKAA